MVHPIFTVLVSKPELVMDHVVGYASLMREEASTVGHAVARRAVAWGVAAVALLVFLVLAGVAAMLAGLHGDFHWMLVAAPGAALAIAIAAWSVARQPLPEKAFNDLKAQLEADAQALRTIGDRS
jgi:peptidoglycan/LPS O-acetylase OafA/YrhL